MGCQKLSTDHSAPTGGHISLLEGDQIDYRLREYIQILEDPNGTLTIEEAAQPNFNTFQSYQGHDLKIKTHTYYWGKLLIQNQLEEADQNQEWILTFSNTWTELEIYTLSQNGQWQMERNGTFTSDQYKPFAPTAKGNSIKINLAPNKLSTLYFRGISNRKAVTPSFYLRLQHLSLIHI